MMCNHVARRYGHIVLQHANYPTDNYQSALNVVTFFTGVSIERARDGAVARLNTANRNVFSTLERNVYTSRQFYKAADTTLRRSGLGVVGELSHKVSVVGGEQHVNLVPNKGRGGATLDCIHFCHPGASAGRRYSGAGSVPRTVYAVREGCFGRVHHVVGRGLLMKAEMRVPLVAFYHMVVSI
jgi:hypothetical protein